MEAYSAGENARKALHYKEATPKQLAEIREKMKAENKRNGIVLSIVGGIIVCIIIWLTITVF